MKNVVETLPREVVFELDSDALAGLVIDIVGLQERRIVRVFDVAEPVGPWTHRVRLRPAGTLRIRVARPRPAPGREALRQRLTRPAHAARIEFAGAYHDDGAVERRRSISNDSAAAVDDVSTTWDERAEAAIRDVLGDVAGRATFAIGARGDPVGLPGRVAPEASIGRPRRTSHGLLDTDPDSPDSLATSLGRTVDAPDDQWRFRVFRSGTASTIAELVPLLDHLGLHAIDERPYVFDCPDGPVHLYDIGVRVDADVRLRTASQRSISRPRCSWRSPAS